MSELLEEGVILFNGVVPESLLKLSDQIKASDPPLHQIGDVVIVPPGRCAIVRFMSQDITSDYFPSNVWIYAVTGKDLRHFEYHEEKLVISTSPAD